jgi:flagellar biosynthesis GTPase FlhF
VRSWPTPSGSWYPIACPWEDTAGQDFARQGGPLMLSLADFPEVTGFFSYSRRDDERSDGALSRLRARIYAELSMQLGRDLRVWQDTVAIPEGALWEAAINRAITESIFFIPIVTPSALGSAHCRFEFESFLKRETELGRDDLVFPILYVRVPALEKEEQWRSDDVLRVIGSRQYLDWQKVRYRSFTEAEVAEKISQYCGSIVEALRQPWVSLEERRRLEEAKAQQLAHERRLEAEAKRRADEGERRKEAEIKQRADEEQRRTEAETKLRQQAEYERAEAKRCANEEENRRQIEAEARQQSEKDVAAGRQKPNAGRSRSRSWPSQRRNALMTLLHLTRFSPPVPKAPTRSRLGTCARCWRRATRPSRRQWLATTQSCSKRFSRPTRRALRLNKYASTSEVYQFRFDCRVEIFCWPVVWLGSRYFRSLSF